MAQSTFAFRDAVKRYIKALNHNGIHVNRIFLYGSHAKNTVHADSDIDLIILSEDFTGKNLLERLQALGMARYKIPEPIQAYGFTPEEVEKRQLTAFWEEILDTEAIPLEI